MTRKELIKESGRAHFNNARHLEWGAVIKDSFDRYFESEEYDQFCQELVNVDDETIREKLSAHLYGGAESKLQEFSKTQTRKEVEQELLHDGLDNLN